MLKTASEIYFKNFMYWLFLIGLVYLPMYTCLYLVPKYFIINPQVLITSRENLTAMLITLLPYVLFSPLSIAVISSVTKQYMSRKTVIVSEVLDCSIIKWFRLIWTAILFYSLVAIMFFAVLPSIYFFVSFYFCLTVTALSDYTGFQAMKICRLSLIGRWWKAFGLIILYFVFAIAFHELILSLLVHFETFAARILFSVINELFGIFLNIVITVWFLSASMIRQEEKI